MNEERRRLAPLGDTTEYRVAAGLPDVRGWTVVGGDGAVIGRVVELLVDRQAGRVRYLECELMEGGVGRGRSASGYTSPTASKSTTPKPEPSLPAGSAPKPTKPTR